MWRIYSIHNWMFILHRVTGVALLVYFVAHVVTIATALRSGPQAFTAVMSTFTHPAFRAVEFAVVGCIAFHGLNGLRLIAAERGWTPRHTDGLAQATVATTIGIWALAAVMGLVL